MLYHTYYKGGEESYLIYYLLFFLLLLLLLAISNDNSVAEVVESELLSSVTLGETDRAAPW